MFEPGQLESSYTHCRRITRAAARNFFYAIYLLPRPKRDALCALYAFMRRADDISDSPGDLPIKLEQMRFWRRAMDAALAGNYGGDPALPGFHHAVVRFGIPARYLHDLISGTEMDLSIASYETFHDLREYCYRVAGTVGLCCLHVFGFSDPRAPELAERLGIAFQLTNILRDIKCDYAMGRIYLPKEDFVRFKVEPKDLAGSTLVPSLRELIEFEAQRAWEFYAAGEELLPLVREDSRPALWALMRIYSDLLGEIEARGYDVFSQEAVRLSSLHKLGVMLRARLGWWGAENGIEKRHRNRRRPGGTLVGRRAG
jgi:phytoene synthase